MATTRRNLGSAMPPELDGACSRETMQIDPRWPNFFPVLDIPQAAVLAPSRQLEEQMATLFDASDASTALRLYLILACCAARGETVTFEDLAERARRDARDRLTGSLTLVTRWCQSNGLPVLTSIVVDPLTGSPAPDFKAVPRGEIPLEQEKVWAFDWYEIVPPTVTELGTEGKGSPP